MEYDNFQKIISHLFYNRQINYFNKKQWRNSFRMHSLTNMKKKGFQREKMKANNYFFQEKIQKMIIQKNQMMDRISSKYQLMKIFSSIINISELKGEMDLKLGVYIDQQTQIIGKQMGYNFSIFEVKVKMSMIQKRQLCKKSFLLSIEKNVAEIESNHTDTFQKKPQNYPHFYHLQTGRIIRIEVQVKPSLLILSFNPIPKQVLSNADALTKMLIVTVKEEFISSQATELELNFNQYKEIIQQIYCANRSYKKKSKKIKNSTIKAPLRTKKNYNKKSKSSEIDESYLPKSNQSISEKQQEISNLNSTVQNEKYQITSLHQNIEQLDLIIYDKIVQMKEGDQMQQLLKGIGLLQQEKLQNKSTFEINQNGDSIMEFFSDIQSQSQHLLFMDDSYNCWGNKEKMFTYINKKLFGESQL